MRAGSVFRRCGKCDARVESKKCTGCGYDSSTWGFVVDVTEKDGRGRLIGPRRQRKQFGFKTKAVAQDALSRFQVQKAEGTYIQPARMTVGEYLDQWLPGVRGEVRASTLGTYELAVRRLKPLIGEVPLQSLTFNQVKAAYQALTEGGRATGGALSPKTVHNCHLMLRRALRDAVRGHLIAHNPADAAHKLPRDSRPELTTWSAQELHRFLASIAEHPLHPLFRLAASTGMRRGELLGLRWRDVDLDKARLSVRQQLSRQGEQVAFGPVKTKAGRRSVSLDAVSVEVLQVHHEARKVIVAAFGNAYPAHDLVFSHADGSRFDPDVISQTFDRLVREVNGLRRVRLHDLRHTHATLALQAGVSVKVMSERLGHSTTSVTQDLYQHVIPGMQEDAAARIAAVVDGLGG